VHSLYRISPLCSYPTSSFTFDFHVHILWNLRLGSMWYNYARSSPPKFDLYLYNCFSLFRGPDISQFLVLIGFICDWSSITFLFILLSLLCSFFFIAYDCSLYLSSVSCFHFGLSICTWFHAWSRLTLPFITSHVHAYSSHYSNTVILWAVGNNH
jgi:hypothetical protein